MTPEAGHVPVPRGPGPVTALTSGSAAAAGAGAGGAGGANGSCPAGTSGAAAWGEQESLRDGCKERAGCWERDRDSTDLRFCRWDPGPGGCGSCEEGGAGGAPKKARNPPAGDIICPTLPWSSLGFTEGSGLPTSPDTRANWLGDIRPAWRGTEDTWSQPGGKRIWDSQQEQWRAKSRSHAEGKVG